MPKEIRHTGAFVAVDEKGNKQTLHVFTDICDARTFDDPDAELEGLMQIRTEDGKAVNRLGKGKYKIVQTEEILTSDDPNAP